MRHRFGIVCGMMILMGAPFAWSQDLAKVNGHVITDQDLKQALGNLSEGQRKHVLKDSNSKRQVLNGIISEELLVERAKAKKLDQDPEYKAAVVAFEKQYLANKLLQAELGSKLTDKAAHRYYDAHKDRYSTDQVHAWHILLPTQSEALAVLKMAEKPDADFQALAEKYSKDPSAKDNRGDLGFFGRDRMVREFSDAAFSAKEGEIVGPVKTDYGYHIIKVVKKRMGTTLPYEDVEMKVKSDLRQDLIKNYVAQLREHAKIEADDSQL